MIDIMSQSYFMTCMTIIYNITLYPLFKFKIKKKENKNQNKIK